MSLPSALQAFATQPLLTAARGLFKDTLNIPLSPLADSPITPQRFFRDAYRADRHDSIDKLFLVGRITDDSFHAAKAAQSEASDLDTAVAQASADDYQGMFLIAADLGTRELTRSALAARTRDINRTFSSPVIVLFKHSTAKQPVLSIGVASRRPHKRDHGKDVLGKVSMIREIHPQVPHRGHLEILKDLSLAELEKNAGKGKRGHKIDSFKSFHAALEQIFNTDLLNARFYKELANWYFWALPKVRFPNDTGIDSDEKHQASSLIRLITRLIFCWFLKQKDGLVPEQLFIPEELSKLLKGFDPESETSSTYYHAILQNLFFATLNQRMGKDSKGNSYRVFATDEGFQKNKTTYDVNNLYRYETVFKVSQDEALALFADIPFLNGGLFECLDRTEDGTNKKLYLDGFSRNSKKRPHVPDRLFFDSGETADLSEAYGDKKRKKEAVTGLIPILNRYKFTIVENTPIDQEIALDPELLGQIFENLLASYNEETKTTARKQTGSFYTPRPIVEYMVDESLKAYFSRILVEKAGMKEEDAKAGLDLLFTYTEIDHPFSDHQVAVLIAAIDNLKILDPAVGSGAFPMGVLHKLVYILGKLDPRNEKWRDVQIERVQATVAVAENIDDASIRDSTITALQKQIADIHSAFADNELDYGRKLYLIENCLYGVDIQPIAIQITKLRFFISLICDQKTNRNKKDNHGIRPLPNLETKFVAANTLIGLPIPEPDLFLKSLIEPIEKEIEQGYHSHFSIQRRDQKIALQKRIKTLRQELSDILIDGLGANQNSDIAKKAQLLADWDAFDPQASADFFDPHWMFGRSLAEGFDIVIGNPPYGANIDELLAALRPRYQEIIQNYADSFKMFFQVGIELTAPNGILAYITPNVFLSQPRYKDLRRYLLSYRVRKLVNLGENVFDQVVVPVCLSFISNESVAREYEFADLTDGNKFSGDFSSVLYIQVLIDRAVSSKDLSLYLCDILKPGQITFADALEIKDAGIQYHRSGIGLKNKGGNDLYERLFSSVPSHFKRSRPVWYGRLIDRYWIQEKTDEFFNLDYKEVIKDNESASFTLAAFNTAPKIIWRQTASCLRATIDHDARWFRNTIQCAYLNASYVGKLDIYYVLGIANSRYIAHTYNRLVKEAGRAFPQVKITHVKKLPLVVPSQADQQKVAAVVREILGAKQSNPSADTTSFEREIDQQVYALYGLTPEEIAVVESEGK